jgi:short-subunit dehydrogenase
MKAGIPSATTPVITGMGEVVVITGASAGVGRATVREFARHGARLGLIARDRERLETARGEAEALGGEALVIPADVADAKALNDAASQVVERFGAIDIWINNAMVSVFSPTFELTPDELRRVTEVTYLGAAYGTLAALHQMRPRNRGTIVQVGSALAYRSIPLQAAYCAAKHAVLGFTESLRTELIHEKSNVHVTLVHLPALNTPQFSWVKSRLPRKPQPVPPIFQPEVAAKAIYWAAHHRRREVFVGGPTTVAVWADKLAPDLADRYLAAKGFDSQQQDSPATPRPDNLWQTVSGNFGAHGEFDDRASSFSLQFWLTKHRKLIGASLISCAAAMALISRERPARGSHKQRRAA